MGALQMENYRKFHNEVGVERAPFRTTRFYDGIEAVRQDAQTAAV
jgi:hypothetical protein